MPRIFISYRPSDTAARVGRLFDRLTQRFGEDNVFLDVYRIAAGVDFRIALNKALKKCDVLLAIIGPGWLSAANGKGRRLADPEDHLRIEIATALESKM